MKYNIKKIEKIEKLSDADLTAYKANPLVRRKRENNGGYDMIVYASDQDLDWPFGVRNLYLKGELTDFILELC